MPGTLLTGNGGIRRCRRASRNYRHRGARLVLFLYISSNRNSYQIVVISNQKQISIQKNLKKGAGESKSLSNFKERVAAVLNNLDVPMSVYAATENDEFRKPRMGMWREFLDDYDLDVSGVDLGSSFFVGDAAGRPGDHSLVDRLV